MAKKNLPFTFALAMSVALAATGCSSSHTRSDTDTVAAKSGQQVKGIGDWEGEITGTPAPNSPFKKLQIGMSTKQVTDLIGQPDDQGAYITGKAFIPFYFGSDRNRFEFVYKGRGRLIFAGGAMGDVMSGHLVWIIHNAGEGSSR